MGSDKRGFLAGKRVALRPVESSDFGLFARWLNDETVTYFMFYGQRPLALEQGAEEVRAQLACDRHVILLVAEKRSGNPVGFGGLYDIHPTARKAELRILIGEKEAWGKGYGTEATRLLVYYGFDRLNLNRIWLGVTDENSRAVKAYERCGFRVEGRLRQDLYRNSRFYDSVRMSILREEYYPGLFKAHRKMFAPSRPEDFSGKEGA